jgi:hypothetical protein
MPLKIAFQGEPGAFSHAAVHALFPAEEALPCATFEDTIAAVKRGRRLWRGAGRELALWPHHRHLSPAARERALHHRRALPAHRDEPARVSGRDAQGHQDMCSRSRWPSASAASSSSRHGLQDHQCGRYRRLGARSRRAGRQVTSPPSPRASPPRSMASTSWPRTSRTPPTTPRASSSSRGRR